MDEIVKVKNTEILKYFNEMSYGENIENLNKANEWFKAKRNTFFAHVDKTAEPPNGVPEKLQSYITSEELCKIYVPEIDTVRRILTKCNVNQFAVTPTERRKILIKLSNEIEKNAELFTQIEILTRGILGSDTKKWAISLFAQYFHYYAYCSSSMERSSRQKPEGIAVGVFSNKNSLSNLGLFLAPALAAGYNILLQVGTKLAPVAFLFLDIARSVGIPEDVLRLIPSDDGELLPYLNSEKVAILALFVDLQNKNYRGINSYHKKILNFSSIKIPTLIFDDADLDSACENIVEASWGYQSLLPWSTNTILVQENILSTFLEKMTAKLESLKVGPANDNMVDIGNKDEKTSIALSSLIDLAKSQGIQVLQTEQDCNYWNEDCNYWAPTLFVGAKVRTGNVLGSNSEDGDEVTVLAFRYIDEAVSLANNTRQGLAASVWSENIGVVNEVTRKINVGNVWVNSFGTISPEVSLCPLKESGLGYFGGLEGFLEYVTYQRNSPAVTKFQAKKSSVNINSIVLSAKKSQEVWSRKARIEKRGIFQEFVDFLDSHQKESKNSEVIASAIESIQKAVADNYNERVNLGQSFNLVSYREPRGLISVDVTESNNTALISTALFLGNAVLLSCEEGLYFDIFKKLSSLLPSGVLTVVPYNVENANAIATNKLIAVHFGSGKNSVFESMSIDVSRVFMTVSDDMEDICNKVTVLKNVWYDSGKSSNYN